MKTNKQHFLLFDKTLEAKGEALYYFLKSNCFFKLTGADDIQSTNKTGESFCLTFNGRGTIHGRFTKITQQVICLEWNVEGFNRPEEINTLVEIRISDENESCHLSLRHLKIKNTSAAAATFKAWSKILDKVEEELEVLHI